MVVWMRNDPRPYVGYGEDRKMQRQWSIEARVNLSGIEKPEAVIEAVTVAVRNAGVHLNAQLALLGVPQEVVMFSDDFFTGHADIAMMQDTLGKAVEGVSDEMLDALKEMSK